MGKVRVARGKYIVKIDGCEDVATGRGDSFRIIKKYRENAKKSCSRETLQRLKNHKNQPAPEDLPTFTGSSEERFREEMMKLMEDQRQGRAASAEMRRTKRKVTPARSQSAEVRRQVTMTKRKWNIKDDDSCVSDLESHAAMFVRLQRERNQRRAAKCKAAARFNSI